MDDSRIMETKMPCDEQETVDSFVDQLCSAPLMLPGCCGATDSLTFLARLEQFLDVPSDSVPTLASSAEWYASGNQNALEPDPAYGGDAAEGSRLGQQRECFQLEGQTTANDECQSNGPGFLKFEDCLQSPGKDATMWAESEELTDVKSMFETSCSGVTAAVPWTLQDALVSAAAACEEEDRQLVVFGGDVRERNAEERDRKMVGKNVAGRMGEERRQLKQNGAGRKQDGFLPGNSVRTHVHPPTPTTSRPVSAAAVGKHPASSASSAAVAPKRPRELTKTRQFIPASCDLDQSLSSCEELLKLTSANIPRVSASAMDRSNPSIPLFAFKKPHAVTTRQLAATTTKTFNNCAFAYPVNWRPAGATNPTGGHGLDVAASQSIPDWFPSRLLSARRSLEPIRCPAASATATPGFMFPVPQQTLDNLWGGHQPRLLVPTQTQMSTEAVLGGDGSASEAYYPVPPGEMIASLGDPVVSASAAATNDGGEEDVVAASTQQAKDIAAESSSSARSSAGQTVNSTTATLPAKRFWRCFVCGHATHDFNEYMAHQTGVCRNPEPARVVAPIALQRPPPPTNKQFVCSLTPAGQRNVCRRQFEAANDLRQHIARKHNSGTWVCSVCGEALSTQDNMLSHLVNSHRVNDASTPTKFHCDRCPTAFSRKSDLTRHLVKKHSQAK